MEDTNWHKLQAGYLIRQLALYFEHLKENFIAFSQHYFFLSPVFLISVLGFIVSAVLFRFLYILYKSFKEKSVLLELTPPALTEKTSYTTTQLFSVIHELGKNKYLSDKILGRKTIFSFEIASSLDKGIRYFIRTTAKKESNLKRSILAYLPQVNVKRANEYLPSEIGNKDNFKKKVFEFKLNRHFAYPLQKQNVLEEHDPIAYITGMMTKLTKDELISFQIVLAPAQTPETDVILKKIINSEDVLAHLEKIQFPPFFKPVTFCLSVIFKLVNPILDELAWAVTELRYGSSRPAYYYQTTGQLQAKAIRNYNTFEQQAVQSVQNKIDQPLFETSVRLLLAVKEGQLKERRDGFISSLATFSVPKYQTLKVKYNYFPALLDKLYFLNFRKRRLSFLSNTSPLLLSVSEISDLYHFPFKRVTQTEDLIKTYSKDLPAPLSLKTGKMDLVFAKNSFGGTETYIGLTEAEREKHMYIIGATGTGKTTMILAMVNQDIQNGKGLCVMDPHGDLAESAAACIPEKRMADFIYFNPDDIKYPIGLNLLELTPGLDADELLREKELITESVVSLFRKIFSEVWSAHAHRLEYILRNTIQTALCLKNPTIFTVYNLLTDPDFQKNALKEVEDENLKNFWKNEFGKAGDFQKVKMIGPITSRIGRFLFSPSAKRILEQYKSTINFDDILDNRKILICNLSKGRLGEDTSEVLGIMILTKIQLASLKRARVKQAKRTPFYVYVDEFQTFATPSFIQMLSESRKYKVYLVMAEQSTSQQKDRNITNVIIANVGTTISFRSANPDDEKLMLPQFYPYVDKGEISSLPSYKFYMKISAMTPREPFSGETILTNINENKKSIEELIQSSRNNYATLYQKPKPVTTNTKIATNKETKSSSG